MMIMYMMRPPRLVSTTQSWTAVDPARPKDSPISPAYEPDEPWHVYRIMNSTEASERKATAAMRARAGPTPRTFKVAGMDMMPAPMILVARLKTAPDTDAPSPAFGSDVTGAWREGRRGVRVPGGDFIWIWTDSWVWGKGRVTLCL